MRQGCCGKVVGTDDTLVVVGQCHASNLSEESVLGLHLHPSFVQVERHTACHAPDSIVLQHDLSLQPFAFVTYPQAGTSQQEGREVLFGLRVVRSGWFGQAAGADFTMSQKLQVDGQLVDFCGIFLCPANRCKERGMKNKECHAEQRTLQYIPVSSFTPCISCRPGGNLSVVLHFPFLF